MVSRTFQYLHRIVRGPVGRVQRQIDAVKPGLTDLERVFRKPRFDKPKLAQHRPRGCVGRVNIRRDLRQTKRVKSMRDHGCQSFAGKSASPIVRMQDIANLESAWVFDARGAVREVKR